MEFSLEKTHCPRFAVLAWLALAPFAAGAEKAAPAKPATPQPGSRRDEPMVELSQAWKGRGWKKGWPNCLGMT